MREKKRKEQNGEKNEKIQRDWHLGMCKNQ